jgi:hypothetical protein
MIHVSPTDHRSIRFLFQLLLDNYSKLIHSHSYMHGWSLEIVLSAPTIVGHYFFPESIYVEEKSKWVYLLGLILM